VAPQRQTKRSAAICAVSYWAWQVWQATRRKRLRASRDGIGRPAARLEQDPRG
jgi:hypothetical protein